MNIDRYCHVCGGYISLKQYMYCKKHNMKPTCWDCQKGIKLVSKEVKKK